MLHLVPLFPCCSDQPLHPYRWQRFAVPRTSPIHLVPVCCRRWQRLLTPPLPYMRHADLCHSAVEPGGHSEGEPSIPPPSSTQYLEVDRPARTQHHCVPWPGRSCSTHALPAPL